MTNASYQSTRDLCERFRCSSRTLFRRMKRRRNPFPAPCMRHAGSCNLWDAAEVAAWELREREHARGAYQCQLAAVGLSRSAVAAS